MLSEVLIQPPSHVDGIVLAYASMIDALAEAIAHNLIFHLTSLAAFLGPDSGSFV
jgi:hypothetical protein